MNTQIVLFLRRYCLPSPFFRPFPSNEYLFPRIAVAARESIPLSVSEARTAIEKAAEDGANQKQPTDDDGCWLQRRRRPRGRNRFGHENGSGNCRGRRSAEPKIGRIERRSADMAPYQHITVFVDSPSPLPFTPLNSHTSQIKRSDLAIEKAPHSDPTAFTLEDKGNVFFTSTEASV